MSGTSLNDNRYAVRNALLYTVLVSAILLAPLYVYTVYMQSITDIRNELLLKKRARLIISAMEEYDAQRDAYFDFPRFKRLRSGLYDRQFKPIFTLIEQPLRQNHPGYYNRDGVAHLIVALPDGRYFGAEYLVLENGVTYLQVYQNVSMILLSIVILVFMLTLMFLERFATPFRLVNRKLDNFIKDSMHEINTPLSIINVNIDLFARKFGTNKYFDRIKAAAKTLATIYEDMDYLIKNQSTVLPEETIAFDAFIQQRVDYFSEVAALKQIAIIACLDPGITVRFNAVKLLRIIDNNLSNAIKYSHDGGRVEVTLSCAGHDCLLGFRDYGVGIEEPERIFERYYREFGSKGGFGIGLNIVKSIIDEAGVTLKIESERGKGSFFLYRFPESRVTRTA